MSEYDLTVIPAPLGAGPARALAINNKGQIVGYSYLPSNLHHGFLWENGSVTDLGTLKNGNVSFATDINDAGLICGWADAPKQGPTRAVVWDSGAIKDLGVLGGLSATASAVNASGEVVGDSTTSGAGVHAFKWSGGVMHDLGTLNGQDSRGHDINDAGDVVGIVGNTGFLHSGGTMMAIPAFQSAWAIDKAGEIVGGPEASFRDAMGNITAAPPVQGDSVASSLNDAKRVVGWADAGPSSGFGFRWDVATKDFENLNDLVDPLENGDSLRAAFDINQKGQIVGETEQGAVFLLTPKPLHTPDFSRLAYVFILAGIIGGGGGIIRSPGGHITKVPDPPEPWLRDTWAAMSTAKRDLLLGLATDELATLIADRGARRQAQRAARALIKTSAGTIAGVPASSAATLDQRPHAGRLQKFQVARGSPSS